ncbi:glycerol-3-phosphate dehydrogenase/oxidase [Lentibacillus salicampi]|uniref:Glycerol-3-phosphate dehydrogenase n=1 Tax=Lentibacillus salicampi TaxID=175306 RepID=A0A4Y9AH23_9BACI|nr:glycerol-3-phosphate dehydrogenase/oxidase [Lentibacillus salicampi]TFJ94260.1 glycerol-3-phosphate dehydrogenase/oxidase [Lentibacillus salicampi]
MTQNFSPQYRSQALKDMASQEFDMLIIGGGITGAGLARDAALRGLKVALVEKEDFGFGTSSRSAKLVHGGVRYLANGDVRMVRESARERKILKSIAPHLIHPLPFVFPLYKGDSKTKFRTGFVLFDKLAGASKKESHKVLTSDEVREYVPNLRDPLKGGLVYGEYITEDARFTLMNALSAAEHGARIANHAEAIDIQFDGHDRVIGAAIRDTLTGKTFNIKAKITVNATGPWAQQTLEKNNLKATKNLLLSKGIHLIFPAAKLPVTGAVALKSSDGKEGYAIRRWDYVYVGTTDVPHDGEIDSPTADKKAIDFLLDMTQNCFPDSELVKADIIGTWAGVRPLILEEGKTARDTSRHDEVWKTKEGLLTVAGGKLTTYRNMGKRVMQEVAKNLNLIFDDDNRTAEVVLPGSDIGGDFSAFKREMKRILAACHIRQETAERLTWLYGSAIHDLMRYGQEDPVWLESLSENVPAIKGEVRLAVEKEMAQTLIDFIDRRAALLLFGNNHSLDAAKNAAEIMGQFLEWGEAEMERQINAYIDHVERHRIPIS